MSELFGLKVDQFSLTSQNVKRVLVKDVDIEIDVNEYDWVILVGSESLKYFSKSTAISTASGSRVEAKVKKDWSAYEGFLACLNPAAMFFKPEVKPQFEEAKARLMSHINGTFEAPAECDYKIWAEGSNELNAYLKQINEDDSEVIALDSETSSLYPRRGEILGLSISHETRQGIYAHLDCINEETLILFQKLLDNPDKHFVLHNAKFDINWFKLHLDACFDKAFFEKRVHDSMIQHYVLDERPGHGLKPLAIKYTDMGNYDAELDIFKKEYCKVNKIKQADFSYAYIPFELLSEYAVRDTDATIRLHKKFYPIVLRNPRLRELYEELLMPAVRFLTRMEDRGVPVSLPRVRAAQKELHKKVFDAEQELYLCKEVIAFEKGEGQKFNPQSPIQMRKLLFDYGDYTPTGKLTDTGEISCDAEVLQSLTEFGELPRVLMKIRKNAKLLSSFINKMVDHIDTDGRVRTGFNLSSTTSGRLSSSGTINLQQLPRDNPIVKGCITAPAGYRIVAWDMSTAEVYIAAVLSGDLNLQQVFRDMNDPSVDSGDVHSTIAHMVFNLPCKPSEVKKLYPAMRQAAKAITFGILYGSGPQSVADSINESLLEQFVENGTEYTLATKEDAQSYINTYFERFPQLKVWIDASHDMIRQHGFLYGHFGRKRRLHNAKSSDRGVVGGEVRSGFNAIIQGASSDLLLAGVIELDNKIDELGLDAEIIALVHDSIVALVKEEDVAAYDQLVLDCVQAPRVNSLGNDMQLEGCPMGMECDSEKGGSRDYGCGKLEKMFPHIAEIDNPTWIDPDEPAEAA